MQFKSRISTELRFQISSSFQVFRWVSRRQTWQNFQRNLCSKPHSFRDIIIRSWKLKFSTLLIFGKSGFFTHTLEIPFEYLPFTSFLQLMPSEFVDVGTREALLSQGWQTAKVVCYSLMLILILGCTITPSKKSVVRCTEFSIQIAGQDIMNNLTGT